MSTATHDRHLRLVYSSPPARRPPAAVAHRGFGRRASLHLTRRGRLAVLAAVVLAALATSIWAAQAVRATASAGASPTQYVAVQPGDTVWTIARKLHVDDDVRDTVQRILELNSLGSAVLHPGQLLVVPSP